MWNSSTELELLPAFAPAETQLVRIVQEALANVRKHAHAQHVQVSLSPFDHSIRVMVKDDGSASSPGTHQESFWLADHARTRGEFQRVLTIESELNRGTQLELSVPFMES